MSGYPYTSGDHAYPTYTTSSTAYAAPTIPQYTQSQVNTYYQQYHVLPPQPYSIIPDYYSQPVAVPATYEHSSSPPQYGSHHSGSQSGVPEPHSRSSSRTRTWTCDLEQCTSTANFTRLADLQRHQSTVHGVGTPDFPCTVPRCTRIGDKGFTRRDHLVEHLRNFHHLDIPKRRPGERSAGLPPY